MPNLQAEDQLIEHLRKENEDLRAELVEAKAQAFAWGELAAIRGEANAKLAEKIAALKSQEPVGVIVDDFDGYTKVRWFNKPSYNTKLYTAPQPAAVPAGWKLVPVEPTEKMLETWQKHFGTIQGAYKAMLAAAPEAPQSNGNCAVTKCLDQFEQLASTMVSADYANGYREACGHILSAIKESK